MNKAAPAKRNPSSPRMLIISCSASKRRRPNRRIPALQRYDGVFFKVLRKSLREYDIADGLHVLIISAKYGLITPQTPIPNYNKKMDRGQAEKLGPAIRRKIRHAIGLAKPGVILVNVGGVYETSIRDILELKRAQWASGPIGKRAATLKSWLINDRED